MINGENYSSLKLQLDNLGIELCVILSIYGEYKAWLKDKIKDSTSDIEKDAYVTAFEEFTGLKYDFLL